jgi:hypothetical protein
MRGRKQKMNEEETREREEEKISRMWQEERLNMT